MLDLGREGGGLRYLNLRWYARRRCTLQVCYTVVVGGGNDLTTLSERVRRYYCHHETAAIAWSVCTNMLQLLKKVLHIFNVSMRTVVRTGRNARSMRSYRTLIGRFHAANDYPI